MRGWLTAPQIAGVPAAAPGTGDATANSDDAAGAPAAANADPAGPAAGGAREAHAGIL